MEIKLRTPNQIKWDKIREKTISMFESMREVEGSNWEKFKLIAQKQNISAHYVMKVIKAHKNEQSDNKPSTNS